MMTEARPGSRTYLVGVPEPEQFEAVSCWLSRLALQQGVDLSELADALQLNLRDDIDRTYVGKALASLRLVCGLNPTTFSVAEQIMTSLQLVGESAGSFLALKGNQPRFRYCVACLRESTLPTLPIHWRFVAWRWCPLHDCILEEQCCHCQAPIVMPRDLAGKGRTAQRVAFLSRCMECARSLTTPEPCWVESKGRRLLTPWEEDLIRNGRALLASLHTRSFRVQGGPLEHDLARLEELRRLGVFAKRMEWMPISAFRKRSFKKAALTPIGSTSRGLVAASSVKPEPSGPAP